jgi:hypothetical protein
MCKVAPRAFRQPFAPARPPDHPLNPVTTTYAVPDSAITELEGLVDRIQQSPGRMVDVGSFPARLDTRNVLASLPEGMSEEDFVGIINLAMLTECATDTYAHEISSRARESCAGWLYRFNEDVWKPDEYMHAEPFKLILMGLGFDEGELDRRIEQVQGETFTHTGGDTPVHVTTFGMVQEYLTDHFHGLIGKLLKTSLPEAAYMAFEVKRRETLHMVWYRTMTSIQVAAQPELVDSVSFELANFRLPGNSLIPELQSQAERWLKLMGADFARVTKELARLMYQTVESPKLFGQLIVDVVDRKDLVSGAIKPRHLRWALERPGGWGYSLLGEAILERMGLAFMFKKDQGDDDPPRKPDVQTKLRNRLRTWVANKLPASFYQVPSSA